MDRYLVQTWSQTKSSRMKLPEVHDIKKALDTNSLPERQYTAPQVKNNPKIKPRFDKVRFGQGKIGIKCKKKKTHFEKGIDTITDKLQGIPKILATQNIAKNRMDFPMHTQSISSSKTEAITQGMIQNINREIPFYPDPIYRPPPRLPEKLWLLRTESKADTSPRMDLEFKENSQYQEGIISKTYQRPDKSYFQEPQELENLVNMGKLVQLILTKAGWQR